tara:strand:- start:49 stop:483 length:435 start_codon:yes stop_codon:yes gene_type:complete
MAIEIINVRNCKYAAENNSIIDCEAQFSHIFTEDSEEVKTYEWLPFTANPNDVEKHGKELYANAVNGDYGSVTAYAHPSFEQEMSILRTARDMELGSSDWTQLPDVPQATKNKWATYRQELRDITEGLTTAEEARAVVFPTKPS